MILLLPIYGLFYSQQFKNTHHITSIYTQCAPGFSNPNQKVHGLFHFYNGVMHMTVQNQLKKLSIIGLPKFTIVNWLKNTINMQILV